MRQEESVQSRVSLGVVSTLNSPRSPVPYLRVTDALGRPGTPLEGLLSRLMYAVF
jgi:hypothetical protein